MPEQTSATFLATAAGDAGSALTAPEIDAILRDFRGWLEQAAHTAATEAVPGVEPGFSWYALAAEFTALRQEVNLQTRAARAQFEQNADALKQLGQAHQAADNGPEQPDAVRPLLKTLVDLYDALALAQREIQRSQSLTESSSTPVAPRKRSWWPWGSAGGDEDRRIAELEGRLKASREVLNSILTGYRMSLQRLDRALAQYEMQPISCVGNPFDPECMEVVEVVAEPGRQGTEVLEEVRRGYTWRGRLFRPAQVRVARPTA
jgi:molecular chaperone GrpE